MSIDPLLSYLRDQVGSALRVVVRYDSEGHEFRYVRDDLDPDDVRRRSRTLAERLEGQAPFATSEALAGLGPERATVHVREQAILLQLPTNETEGVFVTMEPEAAPDTHEFLVECIERLDGGRSLDPPGED